MQVYSKIITADGFHFPQNVGLSRESVLYFDIETTGLSPEHSRIYLIGCAFWQQGNWQLIQWFDETGEDESDILTSFLVFARKYKALLHYNGDRFDLPFLRNRMKLYGLDQTFHTANILDDMKSVDLFTAVRPYKELLGLANLQQQTLESFMGTGRGENKSGGDLIRIYQAYLSLNGLHLSRYASQDDSRHTSIHVPTFNSSQVSDPDHPLKKAAGVSSQSPASDTLSSMVAAITAHNAADVRGLLFITPVLLLPSIMHARPQVYKAQANHYKSFDGTSRQEIILFCRLDNAEGFPRPLSAVRDGCYMYLENTNLTLKIPLEHGELKFFYANYQDYYYLPIEDMALHKSIASFVDKSHRVQATAATCYTRKAGDFLPEWEQFRTPFFKKDYKDKYAYFEFRPEMKKDRAFFCEYATYIFRHITNL